MKISQRAKKIQPSLTRRLFDQAKQYENVIDFTLGDPDYFTPKRIRAAGCAAIEGGKTRYSANAGIPELRKAIAQRILKETQTLYDETSEVIVTVGAMEALYLSLSCMIDPGDEVILIAPYWINYLHMVQMCGGTPVIVEADEKKDFKPDIQKIRDAVTDKTVSIVLNSPNNPTGAIYDRKLLSGICALAKEKNLMVLWDECYKTIVYDEQFVSILEFEDMKDNTVVINSCSKMYAMTGWRLGYAVAPKELVAQMTKLQENIVACASLPSQYAAVEAFCGEHKELEDMRNGFLQRRNLLVKGINQIDNLRCSFPKGTFYAFVDIRQTGMGSEEFAYRLLEDKQVAVVPGVAYGDGCDGFVRMAYTIEERKIEEGLCRMKEFVESLDKPAGKRLLMLGGSTAQTIAIRKAKEMGHSVILCDYLPDNPGQYEADAFYQVSTTDKDAALDVAKKCQVDGVVCYASDPAAPTAAYVCEKMGFPTNPYESVMILSNKDSFRRFLKENGFCVPKAESYTNLQSMIKGVRAFRFPVMVKPVDSSGSKGVNKIGSPEECEFAYNDAMKYSRCKRIIVEEFIEKQGYQVSGDGFSVDGKLVFRCFGNEYYGGNGIKDYVPLGECWPSVLSQTAQDKIHAELQRLITCLGMKTGAYNIEVILDKDENIYILELGARNGGSLIPQITQYATGVDTVEYTIKAALGEDCSDLQMKEPHGFWCNYMVHSKKTGELKEVDIAEELKPNFVEYQTDYKKGDMVYAFENSGHALGTMVFRFDSQKEMLEKIEQMQDLVQVVVEAEKSGGGGCVGKTLITTRRSLPCGAPDWRRVA